MGLVLSSVVVEGPPQGHGVTVVVDGGAGGRSRWW